MPELQAAQAQLADDWATKLTEMISELQARGIVRAGHDPQAMAVLWTSLCIGLAAHRLANSEIALEPALDLARRYAASLS
jgi:BetI-type transcriptional repressor, C-terminal